MAALDLSGKLIAYNQSYVQLWQLTPALIAASDSPAMLAHLKTQVLDQESLELWSSALYDKCVEVTRVDGRIMERRVRPQMLLGRQVGVVIHWHDITERRA